MLKNACVNMSAAVQIFLAKNILGMTDQPVNSDAHQPLPWVERDDIEEENLDGSQSHAEQSSSTL
jgi:hypothetical protein